MKALFITTRTSDCTNHVSAWESFAGAAERIIYTPAGVPNDILILETAKRIKPDVIFYIGAASGSGLPSPETFRSLRKSAPSIHLCSDAVDKGWHTKLEMYRGSECFDLQVSIDGAGEGYADYVTVTPIDPRPFSGLGPVRDIRCGFSGGFGSRVVFDYENHNSAFRGQIIHKLEKSKQLVVRQREKNGPYLDHVHFMRRCQIILNISYCGSGESHQIKGRVLEAGWAGCVLLEFAHSPAVSMFPGLLVFNTYTEAREILQSITCAEIISRADEFGGFVRENYSAEKIYRGILERVGITKPK